MPSDDWKRTEVLFHELVGLDSAGRRERLEEISCSDPSLGVELEALLAAHDEGETLDRLTGELVPELRGGTADESTRPPRTAGTRLGPYEIGSLVGRGGMGDVYRARDTKLGRDVALKFLPSSLSRDPTSRDRFLVEARSASAIDHTNVCALYDMKETDEGGLYLVMPYYAGRTLKERLVDGPVGVEEAIGIALQTTRGLAAAHERGVIHRDIKPGNLLLTEKGQVKILDFGVAKLGDVTLTRTRESPGTASYMSPEQRAGERVDARTDLWSLGAVLYEMLTGRRPAGLASIREGLQGVPRALVDVVTRLLAESPVERYPDAKSLVEDLAVLAAGGRTLTAAESPGWKRFLAELKRRHVFRVAAVYGAVGFAVIEVAQAVFPHVGLPETAETLVVWLVLLGFPVGLVLAWAFETAPGGGIRRTREVRPAILDAIAAQPAGRRWPIGLAGAAGGALLVVAAWLALDGNVGSAADSGEVESESFMISPNADPGVAVLPFRTNGDDVEYLREGMVDLLSSNLDGVPGLRKIDPSAVMSFWNRRRESDPAAAGAASADRALARELGATYAIRGSAVQMDPETVRLSAGVFDVSSGAARGPVVSVDGPLERPDKLVDELTIRLLRDTGLPVDGDLPLVNLGRAITSSPAALRSYLAGEASYRRGRYRDAIAHYQDALDADSAFARVFYRLAGAYGWEQEYALAEEYLAKAKDAASRLSRRDSLLVSGPSGPGAVGSIEYFEAYTARFPDDADGWTALGESIFHRHGGSFFPTNRYVEVFDHAVEIAPHYAESYTHLFEDAFARLDSGRVYRLLERYDAVNPDGMASHLRAVANLRWGDSAARARAKAAVDSFDDGLPDDVWTASAASALWTEREEQENLPVVRDDRTWVGAMSLWRIVQRRAYRGELQALRSALDIATANDSLRAIAAGHLVALHLAGLTDSAGIARARDILAETPMPTTGFALNHFWLGALAVSSGDWREASRAAARIDSISAAVATADSAKSARLSLYGKALAEFSRIMQGDGSRLPPLEQTLSRMELASFHAEFPVYHMKYDVGKALIDRGDLARAERYFRSLDPYAHMHYVPAQYQLGRIYDAMDEPEKAREHYRIFVEWWEAADAELQAWRDKGLEALRRLAPDGPS